MAARIVPIAILTAAMLLAILHTAGAESPKTIAADLIGAPNAAALIVKSAAFSDMTSIPVRYTSYGDNISFPLSWSAGPANTKTYAVIVDDPDAKPKLVNHWSLYNLPASIRQLPEGLSKDAELPDLGNASQGKTTHGGIGFVGPRPPDGDPAHGYKIQVFAVDDVLDVGPASDRQMIINALKHRVVGYGLLTGLFRK